MIYRIIMAKRAYELVSQVHTAMESGWKPQGGVSVDEGWYHQAMVKEPNEREAAMAAAQAQGSQGYAGQAN